MSTTPRPRPGQVYWHEEKCRFTVVCGRELHGGWRVMSFPARFAGTGGFRYGRWRRVPNGYRLVKEPKR